MTKAERKRARKIARNIRRQTKLSRFDLKTMLVMGGEALKSAYAKGTYDEPLVATMFELDGINVCRIETWSSAMNGVREFDVPDVKDAFHELNRVRQLLCADAIIFAIPPTGNAGGTVFSRERGVVTSDQMSQEELDEVRGIAARSVVINTGSA